MLASGRKCLAVEMVGSKPAVQLILIVLVALLFTLPCVRNGLTGGYDSTTHTRYQHHFSRQFWEGELYPRWLAQENKGYGSPIFLIQYPLPYFVTALLRPLTAFPDNNEREARELGIFMFLALAAAGLAARHWFHRFTGPTAATLSALVYMALPYFTISIYSRAAIGELAALVWMPLVLSYCEELARERRAIIPLAVSFALLLASNLLIALLFLPIPILYALYTGSPTGAPFLSRLCRLSLGLFLGTGLAGVYLVPLFAYRRLFDLDAMARHLPDFEPGKYFLHLAYGSLDRRFIPALALSVVLVAASGWAVWRSSQPRVAQGMLWGALALGLVTLAPQLGEKVMAIAHFRVSSVDTLADFVSAMLLSFSSTFSLAVLGYCLLPGKRGRRELLLLVTATLAFVTMLPFAAPLWRAFPALRTLQFPFRLGSILTLAAGGIVASGMNRHLEQLQLGRRRGALFFAGTVCGVIAIGLVTSGADHEFRTPRTPLRYQPVQDVDVMYRTYVPPGQLIAFARSMGTDPSSYSAHPTGHDGTLSAALKTGDGYVDVIRRGPRSLLVSAGSSGYALMDLGQLYFPLWRKVPLNGAAPGREVLVSPEGLLELPLAPGSQRFELVFDIGGAERWGLGITSLSLALCLIGYPLLRLNSRVTS